MTAPVDGGPWFRDEFPILSRTNYLVGNSLGPVPRGAESALRSYYETWAERGVRAWEEGWWTLAADLGNLVAPLIGAGRDEVVLQPSATYAHAALFSAFDHRAGRPKIVTDAGQFPSILYLIAERRRDGAEVVVVPCDDGVSVETTRIVEAIDESTAFASVSHVFFRSSYIHEILPIAERCRKVGASLIVDGYQSVGSIPVDVRALGVDAYVGGCLKWLCGGPGAAFVRVDPERRSGWSPRLTGWMAHRRPFAFEPEHDPRDDAWRYLVGTPNIPALYAARPGLEIVNQVGIEAIRARSIRLTSRLVERADAEGFRVHAPRDPARRGGTVAIDVPNGAAVSRALKAREILCDYRPGAGIRLAPHFYTLDDEPDAALEAVREILDTGEWRRFEGERPVVT